jgi:hypothetical protein
LSLVGVKLFVRATMLSTFSARSWSRLSSSSFHFRPLTCAWRLAAAFFSATPATRFEFSDA